jgi:hypothetical protein
MSSGFSIKPYRQLANSGNRRWQSHISDEALFPGASLPDKLRFVPQVLWGRG